MQWGRTNRRSRKGRTDEAHPKEQRNDNTRSAQIIILVGTLAVILFFCAAPSGIRNDNAGSPEEARAAIAAFCREHASISDAIGIDDVFPEDAVYTGTFGTRPAEKYIHDRRDAPTFAEYLQNAFQRLLGTDGS